MKAGEHQAATRLPVPAGHGNHHLSNAAECLIAPPDVASPLVGGTKQEGAAHKGRRYTLIATHQKLLDDALKVLAVTVHPPLG